MKKLILAILLATAGQAAQAGDYTLVHNGALQAQHNWQRGATAYALNTVMYSLGRRAFRMERKEALVFGFLSTFMISTLYSLSSSPHSPAGIATDMGMHAIGAGLSAGTLIMLEW